MRYARRLIDASSEAISEAEIAKRQSPAKEKMKAAVSAAIEKVSKAILFIGEILKKVAIKIFEFAGNHPVIFGFIMVRLGLVGKILQAIKEGIDLLQDAVSMFAKKEGQFI
jgi:hypothetical protein